MSPTPEPCPKCGDGTLSEWEREWRDAWCNETETHYTPYTGNRVRMSELCDHVEVSEPPEPLEGAD